MTRHPRGCVAAALCLLVLALTGEAVSAPLVANSLTLDSLRDATGAACVGSRLFVVTHRNASCAFYTALAPNVRCLVDDAVMPGEHKQSVSPCRATRSRC